MFLQQTGNLTAVAIYAYSARTFALTRPYRPGFKHVKPVLAAIIAGKDVSVILHRMKGSTLHFSRGSHYRNMRSASGKIQD